MLKAGISPRRGATKATSAHMPRKLNITLRCRLRRFARNSAQAMITSSAVTPMGPA